MNIDNSYLIQLLIMFIMFYFTFRIFIPRIMSMKFHTIVSTDCIDHSISPNYILHLKQEDCVTYHKYDIWRYHESWDSILVNLKS